MPTDTRTPVELCLAALEQLTLATEANNDSIARLAERVAVLEARMSALVAAATARAAISDAPTSIQ